jgi:hypothetical protein
MPETEARAGLDRSEYDIDLEVYNRFVSFSAEIVRLSLASLAAVGFGLSLFAKEGNQKVFSAWVRWPLAGSVIILALAVASALAHRYLSSEGLFYHVIILRGKRQSSGHPADYRRRRESFYKLAEKLLRFSCVFLAVGALMVGVSFFSYIPGM